MAARGVDAVVPALGSGAAVSAAAAAARGIYSQYNGCGHWVLKTGVGVLTSSFGLLLLTKDALKPGGLVGAAAVLFLLEVGEAAGLSVDVLDLTLGVLVEADEALSGGAASRLLKVGAQAVDEGVGAGGDAVALVRGPRPVRRVVLRVEPLQRGPEPLRHAVLRVQLDRPLQRRVPDHVPVRQVLGQDARPRLFLLRDLVGVTARVRGGAGGAGGVVLVGRAAVSGRHGDLGAA